MPRIKAAKKSLRKSHEQRVRNQAAESRVKTEVRRARSAIGTGGEQTELVLRQVSRILDKAASKGAIHPNAAARKKSRLAQAARKAAA